jgi:anaerobic ribonucleoside-triphosphate reductase activating protein
MKRLGIQINKVHFPVTTLGFGSRLGIWFQGCHIRCKGCISRDTWESDPAKATTVGALLRGCAHWLESADGVTISGGEPFDQPQALRELVSKLCRTFRGDLLIYSGYPHERLFAEYSDILRDVDVLVSEPFRLEAGQTLALRGSDNQRIFLLSELARSRYPANLDHQPWDVHRKLDVIIEGQDVWMAGIPAPNDMERLKDKLLSLGYTCSTSDEAAAKIRA